MRKQWLLRSFSGTLALTRYRPPLLRPFSTSSSSPTPSPADGGGGVAVKKVTRSNFEPSLEDLRSQIRDSDFVAIDLEMTGVTSAPWRDAFEFDRSDVRYLKVKDSAEKFAVVQCGVCPFRWDAAKGSFIAHPYNFYIFPRKELPSDWPAYEFLCQTTSINFLAKYQFDFNACIHEGISYLSRAQEAEALRNLSSAYENSSYSSLYDSEEPVEVPLVSTADLLFTERMKIRFHEWHECIVRATDVACPLDSDGSKRQFKTIFFKMRPAVILNDFNSHQLKLIKLVLRKHFKDLVIVRANDENISGQKIVVYTDSEEDKSSLMKEVQDDQHRSSLAKVHSAVGFRHVIDILTSEQKLIVGHNCFLDIAHVYSKFLGPLPSSMADFALSVHESFPYIIDTKHLITASSPIQHLMHRSSKSLSSAFSFLCQNSSTVSKNSASHSHVRVEVQADDTRSSYWNSGAKHEAGYDAFMTGCVFAQACSYLGIKFELNLQAIDLAKNEKLQSYINLLYPSWNSGTVLDLSTCIERPELGSYKRKSSTIVFANIVLLWGFPAMLKPKDLKDCICKVFGADSVTSVFFLDATSAFVQFSKEEVVNDFLVLKDTIERDENDLTSVLHPLAKLLEGGNTCAANYDTYKEICSSSVSRVLFADQAAAVGIRWKTKLKPVSMESCLESCSKDAHPPAVQQADRRKSNQLRHSRSQVTCEEILDSLHASTLLYGKMRST